MAIFKCKMCGGNLEITEGQAVCTCDYCGTEQTLPRLDSDRKANMYDRANHFRRNNDYDKAMSIYEQILNEDNTDAEAYWSLVLCKYGIEYVEDPASHKRVPTVNRTQYTSVYADENYKAAIEHADSLQKTIYEQEAKIIDGIQKGILAISEKEEPFDVFICYKESDESGRRTPDSVLANDLYHQLIQEGFKVFFARITLEDKLGQEYEPYIFAALNSAKVMVVLGTKPDYFKAVWVKNEWSRYLSLVKQSNGKKMLIPAYRDMDPYDLPEEFSHLQAQDMSKLGFIQDLIRGIKKIIGAEQPQPVIKESVVVQQGASSSNWNALLKRGYMALEDEEWETADNFFEEVLNQDAECAEAYLGKFLSDFECKNIQEVIDSITEDYDDAVKEKIAVCDPATSHIAEIERKYSLISKEEISRVYSFDFMIESVLNSRKIQKQEALEYLCEDKNYTRAKRFAKGDTLEMMNTAEAELTRIFEGYIQRAEEEDAINSAALKASYADFLVQADQKVMELNERAKEKREHGYQESVLRYERAQERHEFETVQHSFLDFQGYKEADEYVKKCKEAIQKLDQIEEERQRQLALAIKYKAEKTAKRNKMIAIICTALGVAAIAIYITISYVVIPNKEYNKAITLKEQGAYREAISAFEKMDGYKDSVIQIAIIQEEQYVTAMDLMEKKNYEDAIVAFDNIFTYKDSQEKIEECTYEIAVALMEKGEYGEAISAFQKVYTSEATKKRDECYEIMKYNNATDLMNSGAYEEAMNEFELLDGYKDSKEKRLECMYNTAIDYMSNQRYFSAYELFESLSLKGYKDSSKLKEQVKKIMLSDASIGDTVSFGNYNGNTEWIVLDTKEKKKILIISKYAIEYRKYTDENGKGIWESCTLRNWLNGTYITSAFSNDEQNLIMSTSIVNSDNLKYGTDGGNNTTDKVFLLSTDEVNKYFLTDSDRKASLSDGTSVWWWLRTPGYPSTFVEFVGDDGTFLSGGTYGSNEEGAVRPAMWIDISNL